MGATATDTSLDEFLGGIVKRIEHGDPPGTFVPQILRRLAERSCAERAFLVEYDGGAHRVLWSVTIDGDEIPDAAHRIPASLLHAASQTSGVRFSLDGEDLPAAVGRELAALNRKGAFLCRLRRGRGTPLYLFLENRFCPLATGAAVAAELTFCIEFLAVSLWATDLQHQLDAKGSDLAKAEALLAELRNPRVTAMPASAPARRANGKAASKPGFKGDYDAIVTCSPRMYAMFGVIDKVAHTSAPVLITGESGTGKELIARAIHENSPRRGKAFIPENCGALTETLLESELFGYVKGAFTGAAATRKGLFELAHHGTLFLDEVGEMSPGMQKKLLRVLQEGIIRPVGGKEFIPVDVRIISATNRELTQGIPEETFREDLLYRLNVITLELPPLRERVEDIPLLFEHFLRDLAGPDRAAKTIAPEAMAVLKTYAWPGNVRQIQNEAQRLQALSGDVIEIKDLSSKIRAHVETQAGFSLAELEILPLPQALESFERELLRRAIKRYGGNRSKAAQGLGLPKTSLYNKLQRYNLL